MLQSAIVIFLAGSVLCGISQNMTELIVFRAIQGLGGGGLIVVTIAVVGDIIPPRDRGRYQGFFGADDGRCPHHLDRKRTGDQPLRPLQAVPDRRHCDSCAVRILPIPASPTSIVTLSGPPRVAASIPEHLQLTLAPDER